MRDSRYCREHMNNDRRLIQLNCHEDIYIAMLSCVCIKPFHRILFQLMHHTHRRNDLMVASSILCAAFIHLTRRSFSSRTECICLPLYIFIHTIDWAFIPWQHVRSPIHKNSAASPPRKRQRRTMKINIFCREYL